MAARCLGRSMGVAGLALALIVPIAGVAVAIESPRYQTVKDDNAAVDGLDGSQGIAVSPDGNHVYVTGSFDDGIAWFTRSAADGTLTFGGKIDDGDAGVDGLDGARGVAVAPDGSHVYVAGLTDGAVAVFGRSAGSGALTFIEAKKDDTAGGGTALGGAHGVAVTPDGKHVLVVSRSEDAITAFSRNLTTGALTFVEFEQQGGAVTGMDEAEGVAVSPDGTSVYVASEGSHALAVFARDPATGALAFVESQTDGAGIDGLEGANSVVVSPDGEHVYAAGEFDNDALGDDDLGAVFSRDPATGALTFVQPIPPFIDASGDFDCIGIGGGGGIAVNATGTRLYVTESLQSALLTFARNDSTGAVSLEESQCEFLSGQSNVNQVAVSPDGANVYTTGLAGNVTVYGPNRPPMVAAPIADLTVDEDAPDTSIDLTGVFTDPDPKDSLTLTVANDNSGLLTATVAGSLTLRLAADRFGTATVTVTATDTEGASASDALQVTVNDVPEHRPASLGFHDRSRGLWHLPSGADSDVSFVFGDPDDQGLVGDWDCDGTDTIAVYRAGRVLLRNGNDGGPANREFALGNPGDIALSGDFDGDGCDTVSLYRPTDARFYVFNRLDGGAADAVFTFGNPGDSPFAGDFDGDGRTTFGLHRVSSGQAFLRNSLTPGVADVTLVFGDPLDLMTSGDWDGDGDSTPGVLRRAPGLQTGFLRNTNTSGVADVTTTRMLDGDLYPLAGTFSP